MTLDKLAVFERLAAVVRFREAWVALAKDAAQRGHVARSHTETVVAARQRAEALGADPDTVAAARQRGKMRGLWWA